MVIFTVDGLKTKAMQGGWCLLIYFRCGGSIRLAFLILIGSVLDPGCHLPTFKTRYKITKTYHTMSRLYSEKFGDRDELSRGSDSYKNKCV